MIILDLIKAKNCLRKIHCVESIYKDLSEYYELFILYGMAYSVRQEYILALVRFPSKALNHMLLIPT